MLIGLCSSIVTYKIVLLGDLDEFEKGCRLVIDNVEFDSDIVVSVFETNIRVVG